MRELIRPEFFARKVIGQPNGNVLHGLRKSDNEFLEFGEVYISKLNRGCIKGWKKHTSAYLNLIVTSGAVRFVALSVSPHKSGDVIKVLDICVDENNHGLLVVPPGFWLAFGVGCDNEATIINVSTEEHDPQESISMPFEFFKDYWSKS